MANAATAPIAASWCSGTPMGSTIRTRGPTEARPRGISVTIISGLERHRADTIALSGMQIGGVPYGKNTETGHKSGGMGCLTCAPDGVDRFRDRALHRSVDGADRPTQGLGPIVASRSVAADVHLRLHEAAGKPAIVENNPKVAYDSLFANVAASTGQDTSKILARKKSILDAALDDCNSHLPALPAAGKALLDYHCTSIRQMEANLQSSAVMCARHPQGGLRQEQRARLGQPQQLRSAHRLLLSDQSIANCPPILDVQSFSFGNDAARLNMPWLNPPVLATVDTGEKNVRDHHSHTHAGTRETVGMFMKWYTGKFAQFLDMFQQKLPDGSPTAGQHGRLLDHRVRRRWAPQQSVAGFLGNAGGTFKTNRHLHYDNDGKHSHALMVSLIK